MTPDILAAQAQGRITAFLQQADSEEWTAELGGYRFHCRTNRKLEDLTVPGCAMLVNVGPDEFLALGRNLTLTFEPCRPDQAAAELVWLDEGTYQNGEWVPERRLNGDETAHGTGVLLGDALHLCRFRLHGFA
jgi:hypothetical protein